MHFALSHINKSVIWLWNKKRNFMTSGVAAILTHSLTKSRKSDLQSGRDENSESLAFECQPRNWQQAARVRLWQIARWRGMTLDQRAELTELLFGKSVIYIDPLLNGFIRLPRFYRSSPISFSPSLFRPVSHCVAIMPEWLALSSSGLIETSIYY